MPARAHSTIASSTRRAGGAILFAGMLLLASTGLASAQALRAGGSIGVSLTISEPVTTRPLEVTGFAMDRSGTARFTMSAPVSGPASQIVMTRVSSVTGNALPAQTTPILVQRTDRSVGQSGVRLTSYRVDVGSAARFAATSEPIQLRIECLAVAGT